MTKSRTKTVCVVSIFSLSLVSGCSLIFGGSQKVDNKSSAYTVYQLDKHPGYNWKRINNTESASVDPQTATVSEQEPELADVTYENKQDNAIVSLNSVCRPQKNLTLEALTKNLIMGLPDARIASQKHVQLDGADSIETLLETTNSGKDPVMVRTFVMKKASCTYDFMLVSKKSRLEDNSKDFDTFLKGFHAN